MHSLKLAGTDRNSCVCAYWLKSDTGTIDTSDLCCPGCVQYYIEHNIQLQHNKKQIMENMLLAVVQWYKLHPEKMHFPFPNTLWYPDYVSLSQASFIPISRFASKYAQTELEMSLPERPLHNGKAVLICPISPNNLTF